MRIQCKRIHWPSDLYLFQDFRTHIVRELYDTESSYVDSLQILEKVSTLYQWIPNLISALQSWKNHDGSPLVVESNYHRLPGIIFPLRQMGWVFTWCWVSVNKGVIVLSSLCVGPRYFPSWESWEYTTIGPMVRQESIIKVRRTVSRSAIFLISRPISVIPFPMRLPKHCAVNSTTTTLLRLL